MGIYFGGNRSINNINSDWYMLYKEEESKEIRIRKT